MQTTDRQTQHCSISATVLSIWSAKNTRFLLLVQLRGTTGHRHWQCARLICFLSHCCTPDVIVRRHWSDFCRVTHGALYHHHLHYHCYQHVGNGPFPLRRLHPVIYYITCWWWLCSPGSRVQVVRLVIGSYSQGRKERRGITPV